VKHVQIGSHLVGGDNAPRFIAEIGINHNGDIEVAKKLIDAACLAGCDYVKFQKRTVDVVYTAEELAKPRENPFGETNGDLKYGLEFDSNEYAEIDRYCKEKGIAWFSSCWDEASVDFMEAYDPPCYKIASASLTDDALLRHHRATKRPLIVSTGMSTSEQIAHAVDVLGRDDLVLMHTTSTYPSQNDELNLRVVQTLAAEYDIPVGYSGHEVGLYTSLAAVVLGACLVERHITLDRAMWGSDQAASVEPHGIQRLVKDIDAVTGALGDGVKRVYEREVPIMEKLRRVG
jgi:N-acetylneuraminate synthase